MRIALTALALGLCGLLSPQVSRTQEPSALPKVPAGWKVKLVAQAPAILYPTAIVASPDGTIYLGQDPMDMPGPPTVPADSIVAIKDGQVRVFADKLWAVMGLEWVDGTLFVVHAPFLSALRDTNGDGKADERIDLITGLGPTLPGFNGINDHVASGMRLGMDGFLYISIGDKGIPHGVGKDGTTIQLKGGGVIRIRPDGTGLEVVSNGERNPLSVALSTTDEIFTYGNDDDSKKWPNSLTHHIVGGYYGYPYDFLTAPERCLSVLGGKLGGAGAQGICYNEDGLPPQYRGNLFFCDWGLQTVFRYEVERSGGTFKLKTTEPFITKGALDDFRPFSLCASADGASLYLVDWAYGGWLAAGPKTGRLYQVWYDGPGQAVPAPRPSGNDLRTRLAALDHPARSVRLESQRILARIGPAAVPPLVARLQKPEPLTGRLHALWALDAINTAQGRAAIRAAITDADAEVRVQAVRSAGICRDRDAGRALVALLRGASAPVRREAAIALGKLGDPAAVPGLMAALDDPDPSAAWSIRQAIRTLNSWNEAALLAALLDPNRRAAALLLTKEAWAVPVVTSLRAAIGQTKEAEVRAELVTNLAGLYRKYLAWNGDWWGTNPLAGEFPKQTQDWDPAGMQGVVSGLASALGDPVSEVRRAAIAGLVSVGQPGASSLRARLLAETDPVNQAAIARGLGALADAESAPALAALASDASRPLPLRSAALDALAPFRDRPAMMARLTLLYDKNAPAELVAKALVSVGQLGIVPPLDLLDFLDHKSPLVRIAALWALSTFPRLPTETHARVIERLDDPADEVRKGAISAVANLRLREAIPKLIELAGGSRYRIEATLALGFLPDPRALPIYLDALKNRDPNVRRSAEAALLAIRELVAGTLESKVRAGALEGAALDAAERVLMRFRPITAWRVIGPFPRSTADVFFGTPSIDFSRPQPGAGGTPIHWQARAGDPEAGSVALDDFKAGAGDHGGFGYDQSGSPDLAAFAFAEVTCAADRPGLLLIGSSGSITVSVNEKIVWDYANVAGRPYAPDNDRVRVALKPGTNRILLRARQGIGRWTFSVQASDPSETLFATSPGSVSLEELKAFALSHEGNATKGAAIFFDSSGIGCVKCHSAAGRGTANVGPNLTGLALKYDKAELIRSVLEPSSRISPGYQPVLLAFANGQVVTGLVRGETASTLDLVDSSAKVTRVLKSEVTERRVSDVSLMPTGLVDTLTPPEFADLIAFLESLKAPTQTARAAVRTTRD